MEKIVPYLIIGAVALVILIILIKNICIVQQSRAYVIERLGAFSQVWEVGIHFKLPFVERIARRVSLKEQVLDYPPQPVITKDNVTMQIDTVVFFQVIGCQTLHLRCQPAHRSHRESFRHHPAQHHR